MIISIEGNLRFSPSSWREGAPPYAFIDVGPPSLAVVERRWLHEPIGDNQSRNTERFPPPSPGERARMEKVRGRGGVGAATTRVCIRVLICPNLMRDRLVQTPLPPPSPAHPLLRRRGRGWAGGWPANGHKRVEKLDRETLAARRGALLFAVRRSLMKLVGTVDYLPSRPCNYA